MIPSSSLSFYLCHSYLQCEKKEEREREKERERERD